MLVLENALKANHWPPTEPFSLVLIILNNNISFHLCLQIVTRVLERRMSHFIIVYNVSTEIILASTHERDEPYGPFHFKQLSLQIFTCQRLSSTPHKHMQVENKVRAECKTRNYDNNDRSPPTLTAHLSYSFSIYCTWLTSTKSIYCVCSVCMQRSSCVSLSININLRVWVYTSC